MRVEPPGRVRVLFFAEAVSLAHVARPFFLASRLDPLRFDVTLAADSRFDGLFPPGTLARRPLTTQASGLFLKKLERGLPLFGVGMLREAIEEDLGLIRAEKPDVVVGDFRLSLSVSARVARVPYLAISDLCWCPALAVRFRIGQHPLVTAFGPGLAQAIFDVIRPAAFAAHCRALNRVRREHGLASFGNDLRRAYTDADHTIYPDVHDTGWAALPANHHAIGPLVWSASAPLPSWWGHLPPGRPIVYVNLGSTGDSSVLPAVFEALAELPLTVVAATAGRPSPSRVPPNVFVADFLPGAEIVARAKLVICNGGSLAVHQAIAGAVPVLGIASNMNQLLVMNGVAASGAGVLLRTSSANAARIRAAVLRISSDPAFAGRAAALASLYATYDAAADFERLLASVARSAGKGVGSFAEDRRRRPRETAAAGA